MALRPVAVWAPGRAARVRQRWEAEPERESQPYWEYGRQTWSRPAPVMIIPRHTTKINLTISVP